ncbi:MAG TPA: DMT family transporter [Afifellaceae bacterium]|nr:DMT family transporter [Afifellaceae bacterium]
MSTLEWGLLIGLSVLWGGSFFFVEIAVAELPPLTIVLLRVGLAALALHIALRLLRLRIPTDGGAWRAFVAMGLLNNALPFTLIVWGQTQIGSGLASILNATTPLFTVIAANILIDDERMNTGGFLAVLLGLAGVAVMIGGDALHALGTNVLAQLACLAGALSYALAGVYGRRFKRMGIAPVATATGQVTASAVLLLPIMVYVDRPWSLALPSAETIGALTGLALLSTALAYILYFRILATAGAANLLLVTFLIPVTAIVLGTGVLGERLEPGHLAGMALIGLGLAAIDGRLLKAAARLTGARRRRGAPTG